MTDRVIDHPPTRSAIQEDLDSILYTQTRCCDTELYLGGYRREIFNKSDSTLLTLFICAHCKHVLREPLQMKENGTQFCKDCLSHLMTFHSQKFHLSDAFEDIGAKSKLSRIPICCPFIDRGCGWRGPLSQAKEHLKCCGYLKIQCLNEGCKVVRFKSQIGSHQMKECSYRIIQCSHCHVKFRAGHWDRHIKTECRKSILMCPYKCEAKMERGKLQIHIDSNCPNVTIRCPLYKYGCVTEMARRDLGKHMSLPLQHVSLFTQRFEAYEKDIEGLSIRNDMLVDKINELEDTELGELMIQNRLLQMDNIMLKWQSELLNSLCEFDNSIKKNYFLWKIQQLHEKVGKGDTIQSKEFTSEQGVDFRLEFKFSPSLELGDEGCIQIAVIVTNKLDYSKIYFKGDASMTILNQNTDQDHYSLQMLLDHTTENIDYSSKTIGLSPLYKDCESVISSKILPVPLKDSFQERFDQHLHKISLLIIDDYLPIEYKDSLYYIERTLAEPSLYSLNGLILLKETAEEKIHRIQNWLVPKLPKPIESVIVKRFESLRLRLKAEILKMRTYPIPEPWCSMCMKKGMTHLIEGEFIFYVDPEIEEDMKPVNLSKRDLLPRGITCQEYDMRLNRLNIEYAMARDELEIRNADKIEDKFKLMEDWYAGVEEDVTFTFNELSNLYRDARSLKYLVRKNKEDKDLKEIYDLIQRNIRHYYDNRINIPSFAIDTDNYPMWIAPPKDEGNIPVASSVDKGGEEACQLDTPAGIIVVDG
ncbi:TNF receptor-associated factor 4-like isoform X1 [Oopsacas minuta]|uniref:TNF receptor-associated factor 4-like isoform X1 n=1 Tax=Oopsacas minuta TaxID=111878 RepID=A0AAV7K940_9METZ|nr:TNF receptor-associated factor 4-like isoform X1 [Oopsacas minuta]